MSMKKKLVGLFLLFSLFGLNMIPVLAAVFGDVGSNYWAYEPIQALSQQNILSGYSDNSFRPDNPVTRAEFSTMIIKSLQKENMNSTREVRFKDVPRSFWAHDSIQKAYELGLIKGFPDNTFKPFAYITKAEVLAILASAAQTGYMSDSEAQEILSRFYDYNRIPTWAVIPDAKAVKAGLAVNYPQPNFLMPQKRATRAEVAAMLYSLRRVTGLDNSVTTQPAYSPPAYPQGGYQQTPQIPTASDVSQYAANGATTNVVLQGTIATIETYSVVPTSVETPISSELNKVGDKVVLNVTNNITTNQGTLLIPAGSRIAGNIAAVTPAKLANRNASMNIYFNSITLPSGQTYPLQASIATTTGVLQAGSLKSQLLKGVLTTAIGAGSGAALGTALGAITGSTGKGAIYGTAIGGGLGVVGSIIARGGAIEIPSGETLFIKLDRPLSVDTRTGNIIP